ncbi:MAG: hypothetical protein WBE21_03980 [Candidatus Acidiferrales bacterium]|jgi:hypothetical protein|nr:hypothetical protein [Candidatus Acidoferrales bacterium]
MTRQGSLAYYLAAWVCGCFFMSFTIWFGNELRPTVPRSIPLLFYIYFISLIFGAVMSLLFGFAIRYAASRMAWNRVWHWLAGGAVIAPVLTGLVGAISASQLLKGSSWRAWIFVPLMGPYLIAGGGRSWMLLLTSPAGAATAWVLFRVQRAFALPIDRARET